MKKRTTMKFIFLSMFTLFLLFTTSVKQMSEVHATQLAAVNPSVRLSYGPSSMLKGSTYTLKATVKPSNYENKTIVWTSSNTGVATVQDGVISAHAAGKVTITASLAGTNKYATKTIIVKPVYASKVTIQKSSFTMAMGTSEQLSATVLPSNVETPGVTWKSSNASIVSIDQNGVMTAHKKGSTYITATSKDKKRSSSIRVTVSVPAPSKLVISSKKIVIAKNEQLKLYVDAFPAGTDAGTLIWSSSNSSIISVTNGGLLTGRKGGEATITVKAKNGGASESITITVEDKKLSKISFAEKEQELNVGDTQQLDLEISPATASTNLKWSTSKSSIVTVDNNGIIKAKKEGSATITVKDKDSKKSASIKIIVKDPKKYLKLDVDSLALNINGGEFIHADTDQEITWKSKNSSIAFVNQYGRVIGKKRGKTVITAKTADGKTATVQVEVRSKKDLNPEATPITLEFNIDDEWDLKIPGMHIDFDEVELKSSNENVFTVDSDGVVTAVGAGRAYLTVSPNRGEDRYVYITVKEVAVKKVKVSDSKITLNVGEDYEVDGWVEPDDASNKSLIWESKKDSIASVNEGVISANKKGTTTIYVYSHNRKKSAKITVKVVED